MKVYSFKMKPPRNISQRIYLLNYSLHSILHLVNCLYFMIRYITLLFTANIITPYIHISTIHLLLYLNNFIIAIFNA